MVTAKYLKLPTSSFFLLRPRVTIPIGSLDPIVINFVVFHVFISISFCVSQNCFHFCSISCNYSKTIKLFYTLCASTLVLLMYAYDPIDSETSLVPESLRSRFCAGRPEHALYWRGLAVITAARPFRNFTCAELNIG